jgi:hypothetical protein
MRRGFGVFRVVMALPRWVVVTVGGRVVFVELPCAVGTVKFVAFAGNTGKGNSHQQQGE